MKTLKDEILEDENVKYWMLQIIDSSYTPRVMSELDNLIERIIQICKTDEWARGVLAEQAKENKGNYKLARGILPLDDDDDEQKG